MVKNTPKVPTADEYYRVFYQDRWESLKSALLEERKPVAYTEGLLKPCYLDEASIAAARALGVSEGDRVLDPARRPGKDACSGDCAEGIGQPDGQRPLLRPKSPPAGCDHKPSAGTDQANITITGHDAARWSYEQDAFISGFCLMRPVPANVMSSLMRRLSKIGHRQGPSALQSINLRCSPPPSRRSSLAG